MPKMEPTLKNIEFITTQTIAGDFVGIYFTWSNEKTVKVGVGTPCNVREVVDALFQAASVIDRDQSLRGEGQFVP